VGLPTLTEVVRVVLLQGPLR